MEGTPALRGKPELRKQVVRVLAAAVEQYPDADKIEFHGLTFHSEPIVAVWNNGHAKTYIAEEIE